MADGTINPKTGKGRGKPRGHRPGQLRGIRARGKRAGGRPATAGKPGQPHTVLPPRK